MTASQDTIYALTTPHGRSGVAVIRASGPAALDGLRAMTPGASTPEPRKAVLRDLKKAGGGVMDQAIILYYAAPASFTGEDVVEYILHGGPAIIRMVLQSLAEKSGHRHAEPGEFTRRAFEHGRIDLTAAEAIADLIDAETEQQQQQAMAQMQGSLSRLYGAWADTLARSLAHMEADIDFADDDLPGGVAAAVLPQISGVRDDMRDHMNDGRRGERLRDGFQLVVIGAPNAGKSSLVNALCQRDIAIVSEHAGTTRDVIEGHLNLGGFPVIVVDTAGLRPDQLGDDAHGKIEGEGIRRAIERANQADLKILLFDASIPAMDAHTLNLLDENAIMVMNKSDLAPGLDMPPGAVSVSVKDGVGLDALTQAIIERLQGKQRKTPSLTRQRHRDALALCLGHLDRGLAAIESGDVPPELLAEDIRLALRALGRITGRVDVEDLLDIIFKDFCIGK